VRDITGGQQWRIVRKLSADNTITATFSVINGLLTSAKQQLNGRTLLTVDTVARGPEVADLPAPDRAVTWKDMERAALAVRSALRDARDEAKDARGERVTLKIASLPGWRVTVVVARDGDTNVTLTTPDGDTSFSGKTT
jgi:hypothetical protein